MDEIEISFEKDILFVLKKNIIFILIMVLIGATGAYIYTQYFIEKKYSTSISLYVDTSNDENDPHYNGGSSDLSAYNYAQKLVATYIRMLNTKTFYSALAESLDNKYSANQLNKMITFYGDDETEIFDAKVVCTNPADAKKIADAVANIAPETITRLNSNAILKIVDYAETPTKPSSPNKKKNVTMGFAVGLLISLFISYLRHFMDKRIKYNEEMTALREYPILAAIPTFDTGESENKNKKKTKKN